MISNAPLQTLRAYSECRLMKKRLWMLTHSYNWIMTPLVTRSSEDHTACCTSYVVATPSMTPQSAISFFLLLCCVYLRRQVTLQNKGHFSEYEKRLGIVDAFAFVFSESVPSCAPHETFKVIQPGLNIAVWTRPRSQMLNRDSWLHTPSWAVWLCDVYSLFNIKEPVLKIQLRKSVSV